MALTRSRMTTDIDCTNVSTLMCLVGDGHYWTQWRCVVHLMGNSDSFVGHHERTKMSAPNQFKYTVPYTPSAEQHRCHAKVKPCPVLSAPACCTTSGHRARPLHLAVNQHPPSELIISSLPMPPQPSHNHSRRPWRRQLVPHWWDVLHRRETHSRSPTDCSNLMSSTLQREVCWLSCRCHNQSSQHFLHM